MKTNRFVRTFHKGSSVDAVCYHEEFVQINVDDYTEADESNMAAENARIDF